MKLLLAGMKKKSNYEKKLQHLMNPILLSKINCSSCLNK